MIAFRTPAAATAAPTILLAEGDDSLRMWLGRILRETGYDVLEAGSGAEVLRHLRSRVPIHLVITDARVGRTPGWEIAQETSAILPGVSVVRLISSPSEGLPICRADLDPSVLVWKPVTLDRLLHVVRAYVRPEP
jgi:DNA-binding response OmpR family regulator